MDSLGKILKEFLKVKNENDIKTAVSIAKEMKKEGMNHEQLEEMLYNAGYDSTVIDEAMNRLLWNRK